MKHDNMNQHFEPVKIDKRRGNRLANSPTLISKHGHKPIPFEISMDAARVRRGRPTGEGGEIIS